MTTSYPSHLTQDQWELIASLLPGGKPGGRPRSTDLQAVINAIQYIFCAGCAWRMLPSDFPKWKTVYHYFRGWQIDGTGKRVNHQLHQWVRVSKNRDSSPSAAILDSQSVKTATPAAIEVGYDERAGAKLRLAQLEHIRHWFSRLVVIWVDGGYSGIDFSRWVMDTYRWVFETVRRTAQAKEFVPIPQRWKVERTFGWFNWCRRLIKDYEILPETSEAFIGCVTNIRLMLRRLA